MKKAYQKPALFAETFELVEHIADTNCNMSIRKDITFFDFSGECVWNVGGDKGTNVFMSNNLSCDYPGYDSAHMEYTCYQIKVTVNDSTGITVVS